MRSEVPVGGSYGLACSLLHIYWLSSSWFLICLVPLLLYQNILRWFSVCFNLGMHFEHFALSWLIFLSASSLVTVLSSLQFSNERCLIYYCPHHLYLIFSPLNLCKLMFDFRSRFFSEITKLMTGIDLLTG